VVAAVEGFALAGGFELMQAADIVVVRDDARIGDNHARFAMVPGGGSSQRLPRLVGRQRAMSLLLTGDHISGAEAVRWGLAYLSAGPEHFDDVLSGLVQTLASKDRHVLGVIKGLVRDHLDEPLEIGLGYELAAVLEHLSAPGGGQGIESFSQRGEGSSR
jgi:enoyl-CoA hydratase/carnithine racemase